jgi:hypothetical protein
MLTKPLTAQSNFEGNIEFLLVSQDSSIQLNISAWFTNDKIKVITKVKKAPADADAKNEIIIIDFKNGVIDRIKTADKKVERESMTGKGKKQDIPGLQISDEKKSILGQACTGYTTGKFSKEIEKDSSGSTINENEIRIWYADELRYEIPDSLKMIQMVPMFTNGYIALGSEINIRLGEHSFQLATEAKAINPSKKRLPAALFRHPKDYPLIHNE